jgi:hypothetical protein
MAIGERTSTCADWFPTGQGEPDASGHTCGDAPLAQSHQAPTTLTSHPTSKTSSQRLPGKHAQHPRNNQILGNHRSERTLTMPTNTTHAASSKPLNTNNTRTIETALLVATINASNVDTQRGAR